MNLYLPLPVITDVGSQSDQVSGVVEMVVREQNSLDLPLLGQREGRGDSSGIHKQGAVNQE